MNYSHCLFVFMLAFSLQTLQASIANPYTYDKLFATDCRYLVLDLCERNISKSTTKNVLADVQCLQSAFASCAPVEASIIKSLKSFNEFFCSKPAEACQLLKNKINCDAKKTSGCRAFEDEDHYGSDLLRISADYAKLSCMVKESKDENIKNKCIAKEGMKYPQEPKAFVKWYFEEAEMTRVEKIITFCEKAGAIDKKCVVKTKNLMAFCQLDCKHEKGTLKYRLQSVGFSDTAKAMADYCKGDEAIWKKLDDFNETDGLNHSDERHDYMRCDLKDPSTIELAYSYASCLAQVEKDQGNDCFVKKTGKLPTEKAKIIEWLCKKDFQVAPETKGDYQDVVIGCGSKDLAACRRVIEERQVFCLPAKKVAKQISSIGMMGHFSRQQDLHDGVLSYMKCLSMVDAKATNECYNKVGKLTGANALKGEKLNEAICNSDPHRYLLDLKECMVSKKIPKEYDSACDDGEFEYDATVFEEDKNCTLPLYGKAAEECFTKFAKRPPFTSLIDLSEWKNKTEDSEEMLKATEGCLLAVRNSNEKLNNKNEECRSTVHSTIVWRDFQTDICKSKKRDSAAELFTHFYCNMAIGAFNLTGTCGQEYENFKSVVDTPKFEKWFCQGEKTKGSYLKMAKCAGDVEEKQHKAFYACRDKVFKRDVPQSSE